MKIPGCLCAILAAIFLIELAQGRPKAGYSKDDDGWRAWAEYGDHNVSAGGTFEGNDGEYIYEGSDGKGWASYDGKKGSAQWEGPNGESANARYEYDETTGKYTVHASYGDHEVTWEVTKDKWDAEKASAGYSKDGDGWRAWAEYGDHNVSAGGTFEGNDGEYIYEGSDGKGWASYDGKKGSAQWEGPNGEIANARYEYDEATGKYTVHASYGDREVTWEVSKEKWDAEKASDGFSKDGDGWRAWAKWGDHEVSAGGTLEGNDDDDNMNGNEHDNDNEAEETEESEERDRDRSSRSSSSSSSSSDSDESRRWR